MRTYAVKYSRRRRGRKGYHAHQANVPGVEFGVSAIATILQLPSSSSHDHPIPYRLSLFSLLLFFCASAAMPLLSRRYARAGREVVTLSAALVVASLLSIALKAEFGLLPYLPCIFFSFAVFYKWLNCRRHSSNHHPCMFPSFAVFYKWLNCWRHSSNRSSTGDIEAPAAGAWHPWRTMLMNYMLEYLK